MNDFDFEIISTTSLFTRILNLRITYRPNIVKSNSKPKMNLNLEKINTENKIYSQIKLSKSFNSHEKAVISKQCIRV